MVDLAPKSFRDDVPVRLPVERPRIAVDFLLERGGGVMDFIAHFWERLAQTPPLARADLHLVMTRERSAAVEDLNPTDPLVEAPAQTNLFGEIAARAVLPSHMDAGPTRDTAAGEAGGPFSGAMLYVPKAHRADVLASSAAAAAGMARYILEHNIDDGGLRDPIAGKDASDIEDGEGRPAIDFLTGGAAGIDHMLPLLLPAVHRRAPAKRVVNAVMRLPDAVRGTACSAVRMAKEGDAPVLNRWRKLYKEERGILFDADVDAWITSQVVFVLENNGAVVALGKFDLVLAGVVELGGIYTFPEARHRGFGRALVGDLVHRIRAMAKIPVLQVDRGNAAALAMYKSQGWESAGDLARVWLT